MILNVQELIISSKAPMFKLSMFYILAFSFVNISLFLSPRRPIIYINHMATWYLAPLHGYSFKATPLGAGKYTANVYWIFLMDTVCSCLFARYGVRGFVIGGKILLVIRFVLLTLLPANFS